jgi:phosphate-selective porin OprO/OprP
LRLGLRRGPPWVVSRWRWVLACCATWWLVGAPPHGHRARADEPVQQKTASEVYFETLGSPAVPTHGEYAMPRVWQLDDGCTFRWRGRIDMDSIWTTQSAANLAAYGELGDVVGLRRARIGAQGDLRDDRRYVLEIDLAEGVVVPRDIFVASGTPKQAGEYRLGHFREPFSLEGNTSANYYMFLERSPINDLDPARAWGLCLFRCNPGETATLAAGAFHNGSDLADFEAGNSAAVSFTARLTWAPILEDDGRRLLHLGFAVSERLVENGIVTVNQTPRRQLLDVADSTLSPFVDEINVPANFQQLFNLQCATCNGPFWTQAEWYGSIIPQVGGGPVYLRGFYVSCGYFLSGENREYEKDRGILGPVRVSRPLLCTRDTRDRPHGGGAWELTARFAYLNYLDPDLPPDIDGDDVGTRMPQATFGVNWYLSDRLRWMFNYSYQTPHTVELGTSTAGVYAMRLNVFW